MKKLIAILMPLFMILLLLTACSSSTTTTDKTKEEDGVTSEEAHDELLDGSWEATGADVTQDGQKGNIILNLDKNGDFKEEVYFVDTEGNVTDPVNLTLTYSGTFTTEDTTLTLEATDKTEAGNNTKITDNSSEYTVGKFTYTLSGDTLTLQNDENHAVYDFVKM